jgi:hypothetical protein
MRIKYFVLINGKRDLIKPYLRRENEKERFQQRGRELRRIKFEVLRIQEVDTIN